MWSESERRFLVRWIALVTIGETLGFAVAAAVAMTLVVSGSPAWLGFPVSVAAGALEGAVLGLAQYTAMAADRPPRSRWVLATAVGAALAWALGMAPGSFGLDLASPAGWAFVGLGGAILLLSIPTGQAIVLRRRGALRWALVNAAAWGVAILWTLAPSPFIDERSDPAAVAVLYAVAGLLMAATVALLTAPVAMSLFRVPAYTGRHTSVSEPANRGSARPGRARAHP